MLVVIAAALALLCAPAYASAQPAGEIFGSIHDQTGAPLPGVRVAIQGGTDRRVETSAAEDWPMPVFPPAERICP